MTDTQKDSIKGENETLFLKDNLLLLSVFRKLERLSAALYLITTHIPERDPIRLQLRQNAVFVISNALSLRTSDAQLEKYNNLLARVTEIVSLLKIANIAGTISDTNFNVLLREFNGVMQFAEDKKDNLLAFAGQDINTFVAKEVLSDASTQSAQSKQSSLNHEGVLGKTVVPLSSQKSQLISAKSAARSSERRAQILAIFKEKKQISVKDTSRVIRNCSEKTLQRELLAMVNEGLLIKEGERRWSTYRLAH